MYLPVRVMGKGDGMALLVRTTTPLGDPRSGEAQWTPRRVIHFAEAVGLTVNGSIEGWTPLVEFAWKREKQNLDEQRNRKSKRRGAR